ncbi:MAG: 23S rRNA (guanosine(2251)-2'-O)-methyltransferase RlmB [Thermoanaerobaculia bacterium]
MIIYGTNPVREALRSSAGKIRFIGVSKDHRGKQQAVIDLARDANVPVRYLPLDQIRRIAGTGVHNGVVAEISETAYVDFDDEVAKEETTSVLILDGIQDPQNFGAILRVSDCFGMSLVVVPEHESAGLTAAAVKASAGASQWVKVAQVTNLARAIEKLKEAGFWVYGADAEGDAIDKVDFRGKVAIVLGGEGKGIRRNVLEHCDRSIAIPMRGHVDSLNVSTAAAVIAWEVDRQQRAGGNGGSR